MIGVLEYILFGIVVFVLSFLFLFGLLRPDLDAKRLRERQEEREKRRKQNEWRNKKGGAA